MTTRSMSGKGILLFFFVCALVDFVIGYFNGRSIAYGLGRAIVGLGGTSFSLWFFGLFDSSNTSNKSDVREDPTEPARRVP